MNTIRDMVYGLAVGDALGVPYEFQGRDTFICEGMTGGGTWGQPKGTWSDDTSMTLATIQSICDCGYIDTDDMRRKFLEWYKIGRFSCDGTVFDIGSTTARALIQGRGIDTPNSAGNGSLMRILPLAFVPDLLPSQVIAVSSITHANRLCIDACLQVVGLAQNLLEFKDTSTKVRLARGVSPRRARHAVYSGGFVGDTMKAAFYCLKETETYRDAVLMAVHLGGDTDTTAAVTGGLAGIIYGYESIPSEWIEELRGKDVIESVLEKWPFGE